MTFWESPQLGCASTRVVVMLLLLLSSCWVVTANNNDEYTLSSDNHKSLMVALGCFWCAEQAFELYAPGVVEAVSGYAGGSNDNPTYQNHPGHYEVILIEYDPSMTSYEVLVEYAWRNLDPLDGRGQFCDKGNSYRSAIFYANDEERDIANRVRTNVLEQNDWDGDEVAHLERPKFWVAETYHQDYHIKNRNDYAYYKSRCGRTNRLKEVWGEEEYYCYHDMELACFNNTILNENGTLVIDPPVNVKNALPEKENPHLPRQTIIYIVIICVVSTCFLVPTVWWVCLKWRRKDDEEKVDETTTHVTLGGAGKQV